MSTYNFISQLVALKLLIIFLLIIFFQMFSNRLLKRIIPRNAMKRRSFWMSSNTGRQILEKLNSLTLKQDALTAKQIEMSNKQTDMSNKLGEVSKDIYNLKIVIAAVGMAAGLILAASRVLKISLRD